MADSDSFYQDLATEASELIAELGTTFKITTPGTYNAETMSVGAPSSRLVSGLVADQMTAIAISGTLDSGWASTKYLLLPADAAPVENESVEVQGIIYPLTKIIKIQPADITVIYMLDIGR
jgi:hypothetical protein